MSKSSHKGSTAAPIPGGDSAITLADGRRLATRCVGSPAPAVLFLTSGFGSRVLDPDPAVTATTGIRLWTVDRPGYGRSSPLPVSVRPSLRMVAEDLAGVVKGLRSAPIAVVGWSAGAIVAAALAAWQPELVAQLVLVAARAPVEAIPLPATPQATLERLRRAPRSAYGQLIETLGPLAVRPETCLTQISQGPADEAILRQPHLRDPLLAMTREAMAHGAAGAAADIVAQFVTPWEFEPTQIQCRTTIIQGERDEIVTPQHALWWASELPRATVISIPHAGHLVPLTEWPRILVAALGRRAWAA